MSEDQNPQNSSPQWQTVSRAIEQDRTEFVGREFMSPRWVAWWYRPGRKTSVFEYEDGTVAVPGHEPMTLADFKLWELRREMDGKFREMKEDIKRFELEISQLSKEALNVWSGR